MGYLVPLGKLAQPMTPILTIMENTGTTIQPVKSWRRRLITVAIVLASLAALISGLWLTAFLQDKPEDEKLHAIAGRLNPPSTWPLNWERGMGGFGCTGMDVPCNNLTRQYELPSMITHEEFNVLASNVGLDPKATDGTCTDSPYATGLETYCQNVGIVDGHQVTLRFGSGGEGKQLSLDIKKVA